MLGVQFCPHLKSLFRHRLAHWARFTQINKTATILKQFSNASEIEFEMDIRAKMKFE